jgi:hypothetical protein
MAKQDKLITYAYLREECDLPMNLDDSELEKHIYSAQEMLRGDIGDGFYQDFLTNYRANTLSSAYTSLYSPYIKQFIAWKAAEYWTVKANFKVTRAGFRVHNEENSDTATDLQMAEIIKDAKYKASYYKNLLIGYLDNHSTDYALYDSCGTKKSNGFGISVVKRKPDHSDIYNTGGHSRCCKG